MKQKLNSRKIEIMLQETMQCSWEQAKNITAQILNGDPNAIPNNEEVKAKLIELGVIKIVTHND